MAVTHAVLWLASVFPHAESPLPRNVGFDLPFTFAGAGGLLGSLAMPHRPIEARDRLSRRFSLAGFLLGTVIYVAAIGHQVVSNA